jgi:hypothetical protein
LPVGRIAALGATAHFHHGLLALALLAAAPLAAAAQVDVTGTWEISLNSLQGPNSFDGTLKQDGEAVTGELVSPMGTFAFKGTLDKDTLTIIYSIPVQGNNLAITMKGKVEDDSMSGTAKLGDFGEMPWTAKRKASAAAPTVAAAPAVAAEPATATASDSAGGVSGKWDITLKTQLGDIPITATLAQEGDKISGTVSGPVGGVPVTGTMAGNALKLEFVAKMLTGDVAIVMAGELGADGFTGKAQVGGLGGTEWTGKRARQ